MSTMRSSSSASTGMFDRKSERAGGRTFASCSFVLRYGDDVRDSRLVSSGSLGWGRALTGLLADEDAKEGEEVRRSSAASSSADNFKISGGRSISEGKEVYFRLVCKLSVGMWSVVRIHVLVTKARRVRATAFNVANIDCQV